MFTLGVSKLSNSYEDVQNSSNPAILIQINNKLISHVKLPSSDWDEDAMKLSM